MALDNIKSQIFEIYFNFLEMGDFDVLKDIEKNLKEMNPNFTSLKERSDVQKIKEEVYKVLEDISNSPNLENQIKVSDDNVEEVEDEKDDVLLEDLFQVFLPEYESKREFLENDIEILKKELSNEEAQNEVKRILHNFKGGVATFGLEKVKKEIHSLETLFNYICDHQDENEFKLFVNRLNKVLYFINNLKFDKSNIQFTPYNKQANKPIQHTSNKLKDKSVKQSKPSTKSTKQIAKKSFVDDKIEMSLSDVNQIVRLVESKKIIINNFLSETKLLTNYIFELEQTINYLDKNIKELEIYSETNIKSSISNGSNSAIDPLLMDSYTKLQELTRSLVENFYDVEEAKKNIQAKTKEQLNNIEYLNNYVDKSKDILLKTRLINFKTLYQMFRQTVDIANEELNKNVNIHFDNHDVFVDINVVRGLQAPMSHILRNSIGHGIESKENRLKNGKDENGNIWINVKQDASFFYLKIKDDGFGLNVEKIRKKAIERGFYKESDTFTIQEAIKCIVQNGFSTSDSLNNIQGRGVGMDAIKQEIVKLGGIFEILSEEGKGMEIQIKIPILYATSYGLVCHVGNEKIVILNNIIKEICSLSKEDFNTAFENKYIDYKYGQIDRKIDFRKLSDIINVDSNQSEQDFYRVVVLENDNSIMAIQVDDIIENKEIIMEKMPHVVQNIVGVQGVTMLVDGTPVFVFNPLLARESLNVDKNSLLPKDVFSKSLNDKKENYFVPLILAVDDSKVVRKRMEVFLKQKGYRYMLAQNGKDALDKLSEAIPDMILLDIEMPEMDGFEFTRLIKENNKYKNIPITIISSRMNNMHQQEAKKLGVNEYLIKPFNEKELSKIIKDYCY